MIKTKKGAASFYIITITTILLMVLVVSFAAVISSEMERTTNNDLSQSAYDSALAGIEDAKIAFSMYKECKTIPGGDKCGKIIEYVEEKNKDCDMVANILGKSTGGVMIEEIESSGQANDKKAENNMQQYYTCDKMETELSDYRATLSSSTQMKVIKAAFSDGVTADMIGKIRVSWYSGAKDSFTEDSSGNLTGNFIGGSVKFPLIGSQRAATPPTISVALVQTSKYFIYNDFEATRADNRTNRAMVYLVPASNPDVRGKDGNYRSAWDGSRNELKVDQVARTNDKTADNLPYVVKCGEIDAEFACSTLIDLPEPVNSLPDTENGVRNDDTFLIVVSLPYGMPETDFSLEFLCKESDSRCLSVSGAEGLNDGQVKLNGIQVEVDSTGRANDIYRRIITRLESSADSSFLSVMGPLELYSTGNGGGEEALVKDIINTVGR